MSLHRLRKFGQSEMKDANKRSRVDTDEDEEEQKRQSSKVEKPKRRKLRKRHSSCSPEEDVIDGFVIASYSTLRSLDMTAGTSKSASPFCLVKEIGKPGSPSKMFGNGNERSKNFKERKKEVSDAETSKNSKSRNDDESDTDQEKPLAALLRRSSLQLTDDSSESGNSEKGYICDSESEDEQRPDKEEKKPTSKDSEIPIEINLPKPLVSERELKLEDEKTSPVTFLSQRSISPPPKSSQPRTPAISLATSSSSLSFPPFSRPVVPQSPWLPKVSASFQKVSSVVDPRRVPGSYTGADALHQELNHRFLQSHSERGRNSHSKNHEMHQHSHLHHHQHQHTHYYPTHLMAPTGIFPNPNPVPGMLSRFSSPVLNYGSQSSSSSYHKKSGKWCSAHVQIAWEIYCHQQRVQAEMSKDPHVKPEHISISKSSTPFGPSFPAVGHVSPGCHSPHLHSHRISSSPFSKPSVFGSRSNSSPYASAAVATTSSSAFSSVITPSVVRRSSSPSTLATSSLGISSNANSEPEKTRSLTFAGSSSLYPWLKSETKEPSGERRDRAEGESERTAHSTKTEVQRKSPSRQAKNFSVQALAGDRPESIPRPGSLGAHDPAGSHALREPRPLEARSFLDNHLTPLNTFDKRPFDYRASIGSIDLNRNALYPRMDPMMGVHPLHMTSLSPSIGSGFMYPGAPFVADSMYHSPLSHGMFLGGPHDPMSSLMGRSSDMAYYRRRENADDRDR